MEVSVSFSNETETEAEIRFRLDIKPIPSVLVAGCSVALY